jgi:hypothetical protein
MKRIVVFVWVAATLATLIAGPVLAQAENRAVHFGPEPLTNEGLLKPCTGEVVPLTGEIQGFFQVVQTSSGQTYTKFHFVLKGTGVGSGDNSYTFNELHNEVIPGEPPLNATALISLISQGSGDNFASNQTVHISPNGEVHDLFADPVCRG